MFKNLRRVFSGDAFGRELERCAERVAAINALEGELRGAAPETLRARTDEFRRRLGDGEALDDLLVEAFAVAREASLRTIGLRPFDVQLVGGILLHEGKIAEMRTGEGKTLVAVLPIYLNALPGRGVHLVTVNDYLARRDARWMGPVFHALGLTVGVLQEAARTENGRKAFVFDPERESAQEDVHQLRLVDRPEAYAADVTYGTNNEFGFDYLRDNMAQDLEARVQRGHHYAILDEVDNILIDEARTPLIISGPSHEDPEMYERVARVVRDLVAEDYEVSERDRSVALTELGEEHVERLLGARLRDPDRPEDITPEQARLLGFVEQGLRAEHLFKRNKDYVVQAGRVVIVDEFTGRLMAGRRWSDGLHQAVEAKEGVKVRQDNVTYATITLQNYFRMYAKLAGMTGTAVTEAEEFHKIYKVEVAPLPTNLEYIARQPDTDLVEASYQEDGQKYTYFARQDDSDRSPVFWRRKDLPDLVYRTEEAKLRAVCLEILARHVRGQPILVGTTSVELSERLSDRLKAQPLQTVAQVEVLREAYLEAHSLANDGTRVEALQPLHAPVAELTPAVLRPLAKELDLTLNVTRPENLDRLSRILGLGEEQRAALEAALQGGIRHNVLNAKRHDEESAVIAWAGGLGAVTIATNMAGRGVDIKLGGEVAEEVLGAANRILRRAGMEDPEMLNMQERAEALRRAPESAVGIYGPERDLFLGFVEDEEKVRLAGGLHVIGSVRHEARRIDNQLRGRAARQGDPGSSQFFLSLEDDLMRLFGGARVSGLMDFLKIDDSVPIAASMVNRTIEETQRRVEGANFDTRKHLLEYDDVLNQQREVFYGQRNRVFQKDDLSEDVDDMLEQEVRRHVEQAAETPAEAWKLLAWLEETQPNSQPGKRPTVPFLHAAVADRLDRRRRDARAGSLGAGRRSRSLPAAAARVSGEDPGRTARSIGRKARGPGSAAGRGGRHRFRRGPAGGRGVGQPGSGANSGPVGRGSGRSPAPAWRDGPRAGPQFAGRVPQDDPPACGSRAGSARLGRTGADGGSPTGRIPGTGCFPAVADRLERRRRYPARGGRADVVAAGRGDPQGDRAGARCGTSRRNGPAGRRLDQGSGADELWHPYPVRSTYPSAANGRGAPPGLPVLDGTASGRPRRRRAHRGSPGPSGRRPRRSGAQLRAVRDAPAGRLRRPPVLARRSHPAPSGSAGARNLGSSVRGR